MRMTFEEACKTAGNGCYECMKEYGFCPEWQCYEHNYYKDGTPKTPHEEEDDWRPGDAPWNAPGMSIRDFI